MADVPTVPLPITEGLNGIELATYKFTPEQKQAMHKLRAAGFEVIVDPEGNSKELFVQDTDTGDIMPADELSEYINANKESLNISNDAQYEAERMMAFLRGKRPANLARYSDYQLPGGKNSYSPVVKTNSCPQSRHTRFLSTRAMNCASFVFIIPLFFDAVP